MSRPRQFYGSSPPGRLQATMLKVLAAEMSDPGRLRRGKHYFTDGAVTDIDVAAGICTVTVQGSRPRPYDVEITTEPGSGVPTRHEVRSYCPCPDAERIVGGLCKHGVAGIFALANEVAVEPDVLARWRAGEAHSIAAMENVGGDDADNTDDDGVTEEERHLAPVIELFPTGEIPRPDATQIDRLLVGASEPGTDPIPNLGEVTPIKHPRIGDPLIDQALSDALAELHLDLD